jgi:hypothetical protein
MSGFILQGKTILGFFINSKVSTVKMKEAKRPIMLPIINI